MRTALFALLTVVGTGSVYAQGYTYEMRLIADGEAGSPGGPSAVTTFNVNAPGATRIGFWLQARVSQNDGQNWGVVRASSPAAGEASSITVTDSLNVSRLSRGAVNGGGTLFGRGAGYRTGGTNTGNTGNAGNATPFPGSNGNENGTLDNGGSGAVVRRIYGFDCYVGATRNDLDFDSDGDVDDNGDGLPENPWGVNGASHPLDIDGVPIAAGFSPWANLYRFYLDLGSLNSSPRTVTLNASALINGAIQAVATSPGGSTYAMQLAPGQVLTASWSIVVPTPGAAGVLALGGLAALRRRR